MNYEWSFTKLENYNQLYWQQREGKPRSPAFYELLVQMNRHLPMTANYIRHNTGWVRLPSNMVIA